MRDVLFMRSYRRKYKLSVQEKVSKIKILQEKVQKICVTFYKCVPIGESIKNMYRRKYKRESIKDKDTIGESTKDKVQKICVMFYKCVPIGELGRNGTEYRDLL